MPETIHPQNHYEVLALSSTHSEVTDQDIKVAYRRALLLHHPDKSDATRASRPTIDQIILAYKTLLNPATRSEYDQSLVVRFQNKGTTFQASHPGLESVDLDELVYVEGEEIWYRSCRCGKARAYIVTEAELEANAGEGELVTGCQGCSLWLMVMFAVAEDR